MADRAQIAPVRRSPKPGPFSDDLYRFGRFLLRQLLLGYWPPTVEGTQKIPLSGPALLAANHPTILDPCVVYGVVPRRVDMVIATSVRTLPLAGRYAHEIGSIVTGPGCVDECLERLKEGGCVGLFPEGAPTHCQSLGEFRTGVQVLAKLSGAPVFPIGISGNSGLLGRRSPYLAGGPIRVAVGEPLYCGADESANEFLGRLRIAIAGQMEGQPSSSWRPNLRFRLLQAFWVPVTWMLFKLVDWLKPDNIR